MMRAQLPTRRPNLTLDLDWQGHAFALTVGFDTLSGAPREVFANTPKGGAIQAVLADAEALSIVQTRCASCHAAQPTDATIKVHKARVMEKMRADSLQGLVKSYLEASLDQTLPSQEAH